MKTKKILTLLVITVLVMIFTACIVYLMGVFITATPDIKIWDEEGKSYAAFNWLIFSVFAAIGIYFQFYDEP